MTPLDTNLTPDCYVAVGIGRIEEEEGRRSYSTPRRYSTAWVLFTWETGRGPAARVVRGAVNAGRGASPTAGKREGFSF
jgi:hypothetical protein